MSAAAKTKTVRKKLAVADVRSALSLVGYGEAKFSDTGVKGLALRVRKTGATWVLQGRLGPKQTTWRVADAAEWTDPEDVREVVRDAWKEIRRGINPEESLRTWENGGPKVRHFDREKDGWTWEEARDNYLAALRKRVAINDLSQTTYDGYRIALHRQEMALLANKLLKQVTPEDAMAVRDTALARDVPFQAKVLLQTLQMCVAWAAEQRGSGIRVSIIAGVKPPKLPAGRGARVHLPTEAELGRLPWELEAANASQQSRLAALMILLTAQRINTVIKARVEQFEELPSGLVWAIPPGNMKGRRVHVVPLPPATADVARQALALASPNGWLFPQVRSKRKDGPCDGHISYHPVADLMHPLDPHDIRHAFSTYGLTRLRLPVSQVAAILHHVHDDGPRVTTKTYGRPEEREIQLWPLRDPADPRWETMRKWEEWVLGLVAKHRTVPGARLRTLLLPPPPPAAGQAVSAAHPTAASSAQAS
jgi:integrase